MAAFLAAAGKIPGAKAGTDFLVVKDPSLGYEVTALETEVAAAIGRVREWLRNRPEEVSAMTLTALLRGLVLCSPAVGEYRARYQGAAGDYDDIQSNLAFAAHDLVIELRQALEKGEAAGRFPLTEVPADLLRARVNHYNGYSCLPCELHACVLTDLMGTKEREPFLGFVRQEGEAIRALAVRLRETQEPAGLGWRMGELVAAFQRTEAAVAGVVAGVLLPLLRHASAEVRRDAAVHLGRAGIRLFPHLRTALPAAAGEERRGLYQALEGIAAHAFDVEKAGLFGFLSRLPPEADKDLERRRQSLLGKLEPSDYTRMHEMPADVLAPGGPGDAAPPFPIEAEIGSFHRQFCWSCSPTGEPATYDAAAATLRAPIDRAGTLIYLCFPARPPFGHLARTPGARFTANARGIVWRRNFGLAWWPRLEPTVQVR